MTLYNQIIKFFLTLFDNPIIRLVMVAIVCDCFFGTVRAFKEHKANSSIGINGVIRKVSMLACMFFLPVVDYLVHFNLIGFIPEEIKENLPFTSVGTCEFFGLLFIAYEIVSILKNMYLCGLPVKWVWLKVDTFLHKYTDELPSTETTDERLTNIEAGIRSLMMNNGGVDDGK